jgi:hypothetical protein
LQYKIVYRKGVDNGAADALSRKVQEDSHCCAISHSVPTWLQEVVEGYDKDPTSKQLLAQLILNSADKAPFSLHQGIIRHKNRIWLGGNLQLQQKVLQAMHDTAVGGHSGAPATYHKVKQMFYWPGMRADVLQYVQSCTVCQQSKPDRAKYPGLLQPLEVPPQAWHTISLDFIEGLPRSAHYNCILVVVDKFSKYGHFLPLLHPFTAAKVARVFLDNVYKLHGLPVNIISDRDRIFTSSFWQQLFQITGTNLSMSSSYHPQSDGQTERLNQCLETFLRCYVHTCPSRWSAWLSVAEYWYNTTVHSTLGRTPFEVLYGHTPRHFGILVDTVVPQPELETWLKERELMTKVIKLHLHRAQDRMKRQADKQRSERVFSVGDWVYLKLQPYIQSSVATRSNHKLSFKFFGPFQITDRLGSVAYRLALPASSSIHPIFHVSQLKRVIGRDQRASPQLPQDVGPIQVPTRILQRRFIDRGGELIAQVKVVWSGMTEDLATWEDVEALRARFPKALIWDQAGARGQGNVSKASSEDKKKLAASENQDLETAATHQETMQPRVLRTRKPNLNVVGPQWAV